MINKIIIVGNLGRDPETKEYSGNMCARFSVATTEKYKDKNGERQSKTQWHSCVVWGKLAEIADKYLHKGSKVYVEGKMEYRTYMSKENVEKAIAEIVVREFQMLDSKKSAMTEAVEKQTGYTNAKETTLVDDEIPF